MISKKEFINKINLQQPNINGYTIKKLILQYKNILDHYIKENISYSEKFYLLYNNLEKHKCYCGKYTTFIGFTKGYKQYCSIKCACNSQEYKKNYKKSIIKKYGVDSLFKSTKIQARIKQTNLKKYGVEYPFQNKEIKQKAKKTCLDRYGVEHISQLQEIKENKKNTCLNKYGVKSPWNQKKVIDKNLQIKQNNFFKLLLERNNNTVTPLFDLNDYKNISQKYLWKCNSCNYQFHSDLQRGTIPKCPKCFPSNISNSENEIFDFISDYNILIEKNNRKIIPPLELDIYIPSYNLAIEFDGLYWHSEQMGKDRNYHLNKTLLCQEKNVKLIHIFEDEWLYKQNIVKARIKHILGFNENRIGARQCIIKEIDSKIKNQFLNTYHIQGEDKSNIKLGAFYENKLVGIMTFSKPRIFMNKKYQEGVWELSRFATIDNTWTPGLASKLLKHFEKNYEWIEIYSYADRRWSQGNLYYQLGFIFRGETAPNYWYIFQKYIREHRYKYRKSELKNFPNYSENKTEKEIMDEAGYLRIYDCGNLKFYKKR